ncbi:hypothetical protein QTI33_27555 [Variovorax sp. J22P271]|uniref:hypothetical protein n=1 Tax=Variovorax davisae TaxID=3053515 RepID=UPI0025770E08|nr:hypothetical protein [Variovorax sp. J22P271]MDM0035920.1 hypothetical protein [Variovorax sp. J22P271]
MPDSSPLPPDRERAARTRASLAWQLACERVSFALDPPAGQAPCTPAELEQALHVAEDALELVRQAYLRAA